MPNDSTPRDETLSLGPNDRPTDHTLSPSDTGRPSAPPGVAIPGYEILGELGRGGMGVVYLARDPALNRKVALKVVISGGYADSREVARFLAEAEAAAAIRHPNVVQVYEFGEYHAGPYFAMECVEGGSLAGLLANGPLPPRAAAALVERIARGVQAAHDLGIVHRDLKPGNVLLAGDRSPGTGVGGQEPELTSDPCPLTPKVTDFGLAKRAAGADLTRTGQVMGTPAYMAPEQARGDTKFVGPAADIYALGAILFECLAGRPPFQAADPMSLILKVIEDDPPSVRELAAGAPRSLEAVCRKCLAKDPHARYPTAKELADDLRRFQGGEPVAARSSAGWLGRVAGVLDRSLKDSEFAEYSSVMFGFAAVTAAVDAVVTATQFGAATHEFGVAAQFARLAGYFAILWGCRRGQILPRTAAERQLWSVIGGYTVACFGGALSLRLNLGWGWEVEPLLYQVFAAMAGLTFFALGSVFWGWCYAFGLVFLASAAVMAIDLRFAPLIFGGTWAAVMVVIGVRLRQLARTRG